MPTLEEKIAAAEATHDLETLREIQKTLLEHAVPNQQPGEMSPRLLIGNAPGMLDALGVEPDFTVQEGLGLDLLNRVSDAGRWVEFVRDKARRPHLPVLVGEGDSWFLHQQLQDVLDHLRESRFNVRSIAAAGDTVANMLATDRWFEVLAKEGAHAFLFSGGGNDFLGNGRVDSLVKPEKAGTAPRDLIHADRVDTLLEEIASLYRGMLRRVARDIPWVRVFSHGYDHVAKIEAGPWIWPYLNAKGYSAKRAVEVVKVLLDRFNERLLRLAAEERNFTFIDMRGVVGMSPNSWHDSIHPKGAGYGKVATIMADRIDEFLGRAHPKVTEAADVAAAEVSTEAMFGGFDPPQPPPPRAGAAAPAPEPEGGREHAMHHVVSDIYRETSHSLASAKLTDFEQVRALARILPPEDRWRPELDATTRAHIRAVRKLLLAGPEGETPERIRARLEMMPGGFDMPGQESVGDMGTRMLDYASTRNHLAAQVTEALFGEGELEPVQVLLLGYRAARAVGRVQIMDSYGTPRGSGSGFLVAPGLFLTNEHVLGAGTLAASSRVVFDDEVGLDGTFPRPQAFRITGEIFCASRSSDFAFVSVEPVNANGVKLSDYAFLPLIEASGKATMYEPVSIIQHPGGRPKHIAIRNSFVMGREDDGIYYTTDTLAGSSGSPLLNRQWQVVGLHHRFVPHPTDPRGVLANRGVRISSVFEELHRLKGAGHSGAARVLELLGGPATSGSTEFAFTPPPAAAHTEEILTGGPYDGLSEVEFLDAIGREDTMAEVSDVPIPDVFGAEEESFTEALTADRESVLRRIGLESYRMIVAFEVSSRSWYERKLHRPTKPGGASGVTIGIGFDLGYHTATEFRECWGDLLPAQDYRKLEACLGKTRAAATAALSGVRDISIPFDAAITVFERATLPKYFRLLNRSFPDAVLDSLPPKCLGALLSLTFNRGNPYQRPEDRFREMRQIRQAIIAGNLAAVPPLFRAMKRVWAGDPQMRGVLIRRDKEADHFAAGIEEMTIPRAIIVQETSFGEFDPTPDLDEQSELDIPDVSFLETAPARIGATDVRWVKTFSNNPDYAHLPAAAQGASFELTPDLIKRAIELGFYEPFFTPSGHLIVAVRGAAIMNGEQEIPHKSSITLVEQKPDHRSYRCVIAVYHRDTGKVSAFRASTVPNRGGVASCANLLNGLGGIQANLLPTGCYELCVGTHHGSAVVPTVLRLGTGPGPDTALSVTTLRTKNDGIYGTADLWDHCRPADNIHPGYSASSADFSSLGCLTLPGRYSNGQHSGVWAAFRKAAGFDGASHNGKRYNLLLTTGMELAAIQNTASDLRRLSHGSTGDHVKALQTALQLDADGNFGALTKRRLVTMETGKNSGHATGILTLGLQATLGLSIL